MNRIFTTIIVLFSFFIIRVSAQSSCSCWQQRDATFSYVPFPSGGNYCTDPPECGNAPYYRNDDASTHAIILPFSFCFWGVQTDSVFINTNGNITFTPSGKYNTAYSPFTFPGTAPVIVPQPVFADSIPPMIAPFWSDVDLVGGTGGSDVVIYKITPHYLVVQWDSVGYYDSHTNKLNSYQVIISDGTDPILPNGNNVEFCYKQMQWTTGDASGGTNGLHGSPATVGANQGDGVRYVQVGLFDNSGSTYLGQFPPAPNYDGVAWLSGKSFLLNLCGGSIAPLITGISPCDTFKICEGDSVPVPMSFFAPTDGDTVWSKIPPPIPTGIRIVSNVPGPTNNLNLMAVGSAANLGYHTINLYAYDNSVPSDTTFTSFVVEVDTVPTIHFNVIGDTVCAGDSTIILASGGDAYSWSTGATTSTLRIRPATSEAIILKVSDTHCSRDTTINIVVNPRFSSVISVTDTIMCSGGSTTLSIATTGAPVTYKWSNGSRGSTITVSPTLTTTYTASVYGKCDTIAYTKTITVVAAQHLVISGASFECTGNKDVLSVHGGTHYLWDNGSTKTSYTTGDIEADSLISVVSFDSVGKFGCTDTAHLAIREVIPPIVSISPPVLACMGTPIQLQATVSAGTPPFTFDWSPGAKSGQVITVNDSLVTYTLEVSNGCHTTKTTMVTPDNPQLSACCSETIILGSDTTITATVGVGILKYNWVASDGSTIIPCDSTCPTITVKPKVTTSYSLTGVDTMGCTTRSVVTITVEIPCFNFTVPNIITPNGDGRNDVLEIKTQDVDGWSMQIFDRWGKEVFKTTSATEYWTGTNESGAEAPDGVYYYIVEATCQGTTYKKDGFVQLIR